MEVREIPQIFRKASLKCLSLVARIELKSSVIGQLAGLLAALCHTISEMDKPFSEALYFADRRDIKLSGNVADVINVRRMELSG